MGVFTFFKLYKWYQIAQRTTIYLFLTSKIIITFDYFDICYVKKFLKILYLMFLRSARVQSSFLIVTPFFNCHLTIVSLTKTNLYKEYSRQYFQCLKYYIELSHLQVCLIIASHHGSKIQNSPTSKTVKVLLITDRQESQINLSSPVRSQKLFVVFQFIRFVLICCKDIVLFSFFIIIFSVEPKECLHRSLIVKIELR